jgi:hypothetical protein
MWKRRRLHGSEGTVLWDTQPVNANGAADMLLWDPGEGDDDDADDSTAHDRDAGDRLPPSGVITSLRAGLYRVALGFFASSPQSVTLCVNGAPAVTTASAVAAAPALQSAAADANVTYDSLLQTSAITATPQSKLAGSGIASDASPASTATATAAPPQTLINGAAQLHAHPVGSVAGLSLIHFLALPANARLSLRFRGAVRGQGFLEVTKL